MGSVGSQQILIILIIALVIFGAGKLPQIGDGLGKAIRNFKKSAKDAEDALDITPETDKKKIENENKDA
ncbi:MAG: twin-arginine translocase TatA/TatE family subunit [Geovibrio sp.]|jgi:sec-independent protein translocase protein TatA|uniref:twin-arginine translocase TatA/TatE family subunit n=1 Tax=Geovibrio ferrireducens TaxID=46201 RepID=UPI000EDF3762|nr:twin-arginine translocase TatA/TatE family subunit [Geovibrio ferrireducens]MCD8490504.1 twin-arginine translocase TatA/TatE family subunit [Geovibrio sp.]MCD8568477.1 twin-arginine translocase TatA/TatE family subunit [Geovibrio sp.]HAL86492.1 twin-arginine translocase TatA/TatE family subunit [Deferribacteraceae bacterium]